MKCYLNIIDKKIYDRERLKLGNYTWLTEMGLCPIFWFWDVVRLNNYLDKNKNLCYNKNTIKVVTNH